MALNCCRMMCLRRINVSSLLARNIYTSPKPLATMKVAPYKAPAVEGYDERNMRLKRPLSPHLTVYSWQVTMVLSITHRITGLALTSYAAGLGIGALLLPQSIPVYLAAANLSPATILFGKFLLAYPLSYHLCNGIRHLNWDMGKSLSIKGVYSTGYLMLGASTILTLALLML